MIKWTVLLLLANAYVFGQDVTIKPSTKQLITIEPNFQLTYPSTYDQYTVDKWAKGKLYYANGTSKQYDSLNFDRYGNVIKTVINSKPLSVYPIGLAGALIYVSKHSGHVFIKAVLDGTPKLLEVCSAGKFILANTLITSEEAERKTIKSDDIRFVPKQEPKINVSKKFYVWNGSEWSMFKPTKGAIINLFKLDKKVVHDYFATNKLKSTTEGGIILLFQHFNNLE